MAHIRFHENRVVRIGSLVKLLFLISGRHFSHKMITNQHIAHIEVIKDYLELLLVKKKI